VLAFAHIAELDLMSRLRCARRDVFRISARGKPIWGTDNANRHAGFDL